MTIYGIIHVETFIFVGPRLEFSCFIYGRWSKSLNTNCLPKQPRQTNSPDPNQTASASDQGLPYSDKLFMNSSPDNGQFI